MYFFNFLLLKIKLQLYSFLPCRWLTLITSSKINLTLHSPWTWPKTNLVIFQEMRIKVSPLVDASGRIHLSYLDAWRSPESQLLALVQHCRVAFGESPPVFAKATRQLSASVNGETPAASVSYQVQSISVNLHRIKFYRLTLLTKECVTS